MDVAAVHSETMGDEGLQMMPVVEWPQKPLLITVVVTHFALCALVCDFDDPHLLPEGTTVTLQPAPLHSSFDADKDEHMNEDVITRDCGPASRRTTTPTPRPRSIRLRLGLDAPKVFTTEELSALKGRYRVLVHCPGFTVTSLRINGNEIGVTQPVEAATNPDEFRRLGVEGTPAGNGALAKPLTTQKGRDDTFIVNLDEGLWTEESTVLIETTVRFFPKPRLRLHAVAPFGKGGQAFGRSIDVVLCLDATGSMGPYLTAAKEAIAQAALELRANYPQQLVRFGVVCYRDINPVDADDEVGSALGLPVVSHPLTDQEGDVVNFLNGIEAKGGFDVPEDLLAGLDEALRLDWQATTRLLCVVTDAPCHGRRFHDLGEGEDSFPREEDAPHGFFAETVLAEAAAKNISVVIGRAFFGGSASCKKRASNGSSVLVGGASAAPFDVGFASSTDKMVAEFRRIAVGRAGGGDDQKTTDWSGPFPNITFAIICGTLYFWLY